MKTVVFMLFFVGVHNICAQAEQQFSAGIESNSQYYVDDKETGDFNENHRFRSNNYFKLDYSFSNFFATAQFESYAPEALLNFSPNLDSPFNFSTYTIGYKNDKVEASIGHFYEQFGSGLILRSWEDRDLGLNNALFGGTFLYHFSDNINASILYGKQKVGFDLSDGKILGINSEFNLSELFNSDSYIYYGLSFVNRTQNIEAFSDLNNSTYSFSNRLEFNKNNFSSSIEFITKSDEALVETGTILNTEFNGQALLLNLGYSKKGFGFNTSFRRLENFYFYTDREVYGNIYNEQLVNYIPSLTKQHEFSLSNIYIYQAQPQLTFNPLGKAGEIGFQIDLYYKLKKNTFLGGKTGANIAFNYAQWHGLDATFDLNNRTYESNYLSFGEKYFHDINIEYRKKWSKKWTSIFFGSHVFYNKTYLEENTGEVNAFIIAVENTLRFSNKNSVKLKLEHLNTPDDKKNWWAGTLEYFATPKISFYVSDLYNYGNDQEIEKIHFYSVGGSYKKGKTSLSIGYGRQRGGLVCIGGICRIVPQTTGFSVRLSTSL